MKLLLVVLILLLSGCGSESIIIHRVSPESMAAISGGLRLGWTSWDVNSCDIFILPDELLAPGCFDITYTHEERHCTDGSFHPNDEPEARSYFEQYEPEFIECGNATIKLLRN